MDYQALADLLFPAVVKTPADLELRYPPRTLPAGARVTRIAPSPTGFMHLGNLYGALADERLAHQSGGVFFLRIEDTDQKREVAGGVKTILDVFRHYALPFDEGATETGDVGDYGPYRQRQRADVYHACARWLVAQGLAYPCFLTEEELAAMRESQAEQKLNFGCYGSFALYRNTGLDEIKALLAAGRSYVVRFKSGGDAAHRIRVDDLIRGTLELPENDQDVVLLKSDGIPTYHFAHVVDDHFMRTTVVVRGEEWLATLPIHVQLFAAMGWKAPKYLHTAQLMKMDGGAKRKLSKRKDPELALSFYQQQGYPVQSVKEYLLSLLNSNFEEWRAANPAKPMEEFPFNAKKMGTSGALFDMEKLKDVSRSVLAGQSADDVYLGILTWAREFDEAFAELLSRDAHYAAAILAIGRGGKKPRKDLAVYADARETMAYFYDELFVPNAELPENVAPALAADMVGRYLQRDWQLADPDAWFNGVKAVAREVGFADNMKDYKQNPAAYAGHVGDVSMVLRLAVTGRAQSPDLREVMQVLGEDRTRRRLTGAAHLYKNMAEGTFDTEGVEE